MPDGQTWGESLFLAVRRAGGMPLVLEQLGPVTERAWGLQSPTGYNQLFKLRERPEPRTLPYVRAWLVAVATDADLDYLGLADDELPPTMNPAQVRRMLDKT